MGLEENLNLFCATIQAELNHGNREFRILSTGTWLNLTSRSLKFKLPIAFQDFTNHQPSSSVTVTRDYQASLHLLKTLAKKIEATERTKETFI
jgi:hypothetical protein